MTAADVARLVAEQYELPFVDLVASEVDLEVASGLPEELARRYSAVPVSARDDEVVVALADPTRVLDAHDLRAAITAPVRFVAASPDAVNEAIALAHAPVRLHEVEPSGDDVHDPELDDAMADDLLEATASVHRWDGAGDETPDADASVAVVTGVDTTQEPPAVESLPELLEQVLALGASHVHFTPRAEGVLVRARVDGMLREVDPDAADSVETVAWLKAVTDLEIGGRRAHREATVAVPFGDSMVDLRLVLVRTAAERSSP